MDVLRLHVLLVNEDPKLLAQMEGILSEQGFTVKTVSTLKEAKAAIEHERFQVLVSDITMPENDGIELCKKYGHVTPVVMLQGREDPKIFDLLAPYGVCFLEKSDVTTRLSKAVWTAFKRFRINQQLERDLAAA